MGGSTYRIARPQVCQPLRVSESGRPAAITIRRKYVGPQDLAGAGSQWNFTPVNQNPPSASTSCLGELFFLSLVGAEHSRFTTILSPIRSACSAHVDRSPLASECRRVHMEFGEGEGDDSLVCPSRKAVRSAVATLDASRVARCSFFRDSFAQPSGCEAGFGLWVVGNRKGVQRACHHAASSNTTGGRRICGHPDAPP